MKESRVRTRLKRSVYKQICLKIQSLTGEFFSLENKEEKKKAEKKIIRKLRELLSVEFLQS